MRYFCGQIQTQNCVNDTILLGSDDDGHYVRISNILCLLTKTVKLRDALLLYI